MKKMIIAAAVLAASASLAHAADIVFWGGLSVTSTANCNNWNPDKQMFTGTYFVPIAGSQNGTDSTLIFHNNGVGGEAFTLFNDVFTGTFKDVEATHIYTRAGTYPAKVKLTQTPTTLGLTTNAVKAVGSVRGWDHDTDCVVNFTFQGLKNLNP